MVHGVERGDGGDEQDGDDTAGDGDDVHQAHQNAEQEEVAHVQHAEGDGGGDAEDEHQRGLAEEPLAHADLGLFQGDGEAQALVDGEERHDPRVGAIAFEHEVDAEDEGGEDVEDARDPERERCEEVTGGGGERAFGPGGHLVDAQLVRHGHTLELGADFGDARRGDRWRTGGGRG